MKNLPPKRRKRPGEDGYVLVAVIFMMAILVLSLAVAVPKVRQSIQRDRDEETMQRGKQYIRAIQLYYRKFHAYPPNVDALVKTNEIRFLRKKYIDPTTGKDEWKPVLWGQNKTPIAMGFFGQPLAAAAGGGTGPSGGNLTGAGSSTGGGGLFNSGSSSGSGSSIFGSSGTSSTGSTDQSGAGTSPGTGTTGAAAGTTPQSGTTGTAGPASGSTNPTGTGQAFGGGGIIGFSPQSPKQSILIYKKKYHYNEWEFLYSPLIDQQQMTGGTGLMGQPGGGGLTGGFGSGSGGGTGSGSGSGGLFGTGGSAGTSQTGGGTGTQQQQQPQQ